MKLWNYETTNGAGMSGGILGFKMPLDWLKIGLNSVEKITLLSLRVPMAS